jgi:hypothetical protein
MRAKTLLGIALTFIWQFSHSQVNIYENLNFSSITTGHFWNQISGQCEPPDGSDFTFLDYHQTSELLLSMNEASLNQENPIVPTYMDLSMSFTESKLSNHVIPMAIVEMEFEHISQPAIDDHWLYVANNQIMQVPNTHVFEEKDAVALHIDAINYGEHDLFFELDEDSYFQNFGSLPDEIWIDFDDGQGWQEVFPNEIIEVSYTTTDVEREIRLKIARGNTEKKGGFILKSNNCISSFPNPVVPPWPTIENSKISTTYLGETVFGNAYYLPTGIFDKPFIFVEGVDFEYDQFPDRNGSFGWCQFTSGIGSSSYDYAMLDLMPEMLLPLREHGYDIILLDFSNGADFMEKNGMLLVHLIELVNTFKTGSEPNIVAGASMGGQVSKYALDYMERNEIEHCSRLWISMDSPHTGANIPIGIQQFLHANRNTANAQDAIYNKIKRPAARQLLRYQYFEGNEITLDDTPVWNPPLHDAWYDLMDDWGYPTHCRNIAITNGSVIGQIQNDNNGQPVNYYDPILSYDCEVLGCSAGPEAKFFITPSCGDEWYSDVWGFQSNANFYVSAQVVTSEANFTGGIFGIPGLLVSALCLPMKDKRTYWVPSDIPNLDYAPGGYRNTIVDLVNGINDTPEFANSSCTQLTNDHFRALHSFIPTESALGLRGLDPYENINFYLANNPEARFFDNFYGPLENEAHTQITPSNTAFVLGEIFLSEDEYGNPLLPSDFTSSSGNSGVFNYGIEGFNFIRNIHIHDGANVYVNRLMPTHYASTSDVLPAESRFKMVTSYGCEPVDIVLDDNGRLEIGDPSGSKTSEFRCQSASRIIVGLDGTLIVNSGSTVIFESGSELVLFPGSHFELYDGEVIMKAGSRISYSGGSIVLGGSSGRLIFDGGKLYIAPEVTFEVVRGVNQHGYIEIMPNTENVLLNSVNSKFQLIGLNSQDLLLKINDYAHLQNAYYGNGTMVLENCRVDLANHGGIWTDMAFRAKNVFFDANNGFDGELQLFGSTVLVDECTSEYTKIMGHWSKMRLLNSNFSFYNGGARCYNGYIYVDNCVFQECNLVLEALQGTTTIKESQFIDGRIQDESLVEVILEKCAFSDGTNVGVQKKGGKLTPFCCSFENKVHGGIKMEHGILNMSSNDRAGYNIFNDCFPPIRLIEVQEIILEDGYNVFQNFGTHCIVGTINMLCVNENGNNCTMEIIATHNQWGDDDGTGLNSGIYYDPSETHVRTVDIPPGICGFENTNSCFIHFYDAEPIEGTRCPSKPDITVKSISYNENHSSTHAVDWSAQNLSSRDLVLDPQNPLITTPTFAEIPLDSALVFAAMQREAYDSLGNDMNAISLFHEILLDSLDQSNSEVHRKMVWARSQMKATVENLFFNEVLLPADNQISFELPVQQYVDVLNLMTQTELSDSTYRKQFYLELDKGQLFRTLNIPHIAQQVFVHLDDCDLDSLEQSVLNDWRQQVDLEISILSQLTVDSISFDSLSFDVDTTNYTAPIPYTLSNYYFGLWIDAPNSVTFVSCDENPTYRDLVSSTHATRVYPNPANDRLLIQGIKPEETFQIQLMDMTGRLMLSARGVANSAAGYELVLPSYISNGSYTLSISGAGFIDRHSVVVSH